MYMECLQSDITLGFDPGGIVDPRFTGSNPAGIDGFFQRVQIFSMTYFGREVKPWSRVVDLRHVKEPQSEIRASEQNCRPFYAQCRNRR